MSATKTPLPNTPCDDVGDWFAAPMPGPVPKKPGKG